MKTFKLSRLSGLCLSGVMALGIMDSAQAAGNDAALKALFDQAQYWHEKYARRSGDGIAEKSS